MSFELSVFFGTFVILLILGVPTYLCLLTGSILYSFFTPFIEPMAMMEKMFGSLNNFVLLSIPMFMMSGIIMNCGGIGQRIFDFCRACVGHWPGGLVYVNIFTSVIFAGMSGSALADVGGVGQVEMTAMKEDGYEDDICLGITAASATLGPIIPPSIPMAVYGSVASVSVGALFLGGVGPGAVMTLVMCLMTWWYAKKRNYPVRKKASLKEIFISFQKSFFALMMPVVVLGGIWTGYFTPTEAACISVLYCLVVVLFVYKDMRPKEILPVMRQTVESIGPALTIVSSAALFGWILQFERFDKVLVESLLNLSSNPTIIILILNVILLIMGMFLDSTPIILMMVPVLLPLTRTLGIDPVHMGVVVVLNLMIGLMTPPVGQSLFIMSTVVKKPFSYVVKCTWKWLIPLFASLILISVFPGIVLFVPRLCGAI